MGGILVLQFVFPDLFRGIPFLVFSRLRQAHVNPVLFAWLSPGMMGLWLYIAPQLTGRRLWSDLLGNVSAILWNIAILVGIVGIVANYTQSREHAEMIWVVDVAVEVALPMNLVNLLRPSRIAQSPSGLECGFP